MKYMGYIKHDAIVVSSFKKEYTEQAWKMAIKLGLECTEIIISHINSEHSFLIASDGSKEGWEDSEKGDVARESWIQWAKDNKSDILLDWIHVRYGGDEPELAMIEDHNESPDE